VTPAGAPTLFVMKHDAAVRREGPAAPDASMALNDRSDFITPAVSRVSGRGVTTPKGLVSGGKLRPLYGGGRGIRTPVTLSGKAVFKTACFNRSHIPPREQQCF
jgi:hypothetical protein